MTHVHPTAIVSVKAELSEDVTVDPYAVIDENVRIGCGSYVGSGVRLFSGVRLGERVRVHHGAALGGEPQDLKFGGEPTELYVGDGTVVREFVTLHRGTNATGRTRIGKDCMIMAYAHVAHDCTIGDSVILANCVELAGHVEIEDFAIVGGVVPIHQFVRIGQHSMVGGGFRVPKDVPPYILAAGYPLCYHGLNVVGLRRRGFSAEVRGALKEAYRILFQSECNVSQAVDRIREAHGEIAEVKNVLAFIAKSKRGLLPGRRAGNSEDAV